ncbi:MAG: hypothetical protein ACQEWF_24465 [Bacillota bacterium]
MAKELGMAPKGLIKNIPAPNQKWKADLKALYQFDVFLSHHLVQCVSPLFLVLLSWLSEWLT